ncbi:hypothetical protein SNE40_017021 [Patella caerulea]|uniref:Protein furry C-terminal domain-containing protein n=1 Tax=Patella caerulea TaxID=87958 RepID=A0AAN8JEB7_PATCE
MVYLQMECPFIYVESDTLLGSRVVEKHRFCVLEIQECFETYYMRKDQAEQSLESLKSNIKQQSLFDGVTMSTSGDEQKVDLCRKLYKLIFQLVQFFESYLKLLEVFRSVTRTPQVVDMSLQATSLQVEMSTALQELENGQASPFNVDFKAVNKQEAITSLAEYLQTQQYLKAVQLLRSFRSLWPNDVFGMTSEDDVVALLNIYCSSLSDKKTGIFVLTRTDLDLNHLHSHLMNIHLKLSTAWPPSLSSTATTPTRLTEVVIKQSDSSTL